MQLQFIGSSKWHKIQNINGKNVEPHSCWYWRNSISFHWFINFGFFPVELILLVFECRFETFNISCPLFFPRHHKHGIKNQTRQHNPNFNRLSHSNPQISFSRCYPFLSLSSTYIQCNHHQNPQATTIRTHHHHRMPHNPQQLQATSHNTTKIRSNPQPEGKTKQNTKNETHKVA